jgi:hypothetical protein
VFACGDGDAVKPVDSGPDVAPQPKCSDGIDNDGDGKIDYPNDPGCFVPQQDDETDDCPDGPGCPQCADGIDNDGNGTTDYPDDPSCTSAADVDEINEDPNACGTGVTIHPLPATGMVTSAFDDTQVYSQVSPCGGGDANGIIVAAYELHLTEPKVIVASTMGTAIDTVLDIRSADCDADTSELACNDNDVGLASKVIYSAQPGLYYILVESKTGDVGNFMLNVQQLTGEGEMCTDNSECGPGLVCRIPHGGSTLSCEKAVCNDGRDDDEDGKMDYPADPGCASPDDDDETDDCPSGPNCPVCSNGSDDDGDGQTDYPDDTSCSAASGASEACQGEEDPITSIVSGTTSGTLIGAHDNHNPSCGGDGGGDILYTLSIPAMRSLTIDTEGTTGDTLLSLLTSTCSEPSLACDDDGGTSGNSSRIAMTNLASGTYIVAVDNYNSTKPPQPYDLHVTGVISPGGSCNPEDTLGGALECPASNPCTGTTGNLICQPSACGDGIDNDGDNLTDYPADPGCSSLDDTDETDTCPGVGPGCPECADGVDNDGDGQTDYPQDTNCAAPGQQSEGCPSTDGVTPLTMPVTIDDTTGATNDTVHNACQDDDSTAPDHTYSLQLPALKSLTIDGDSDFDGVLVMLDSTCGGTELACQDGELITKQNVAAGNYFVVIDGWTDDEVGTTTLTVSGVIQNGGSCEVPLAQNGALTCGAGFTCSGTPGSRTCRPAICHDGLDNDGDGIADYPNDPGCSSISDNDESDTCPGGADCPACSNGLDDDGDGVIDYPDDPACGAASSVSEACPASEPIAELVLPSTVGTTIGATNDVIPSCGSSSNTAGDVTYSITVPALTNLHIANVNSFSSAVTLLDSTCGGTPLQCSSSDTINVGPLAAGTYYYVVDGYSTDSGSYTINVTGTIAAGASCEGILADAGALTCEAGYSCQGTSGARTCQPTACNDGADNDTDGHMDYPADPGCSSLSDDDETDDCPSGPNCPACSNGMDDDGDGQADFPADTGCEAASSNIEAACTADQENGGAIVAPTTMGDLTNGHSDQSSEFTCGLTPSGNDMSFILVLPVPVASLTVDTEGSEAGDTQVEVWSGECATTLGCDDDSGTGTLSTITLTNLAAGTYAISVAAYSSFSNEPFNVNVKGKLASGTRCDSALFTAGVLECDTGLTCTGSPATCQ